MTAAELASQKRILKRYEQVRDNHRKSLASYLGVKGDEAVSAEIEYHLINANEYEERAAELAAQIKAMS